MSIFESHADRPNQIREEGQEITLRFSKIDENTGKLTWNIPPSFKGCKGDGAYNGVVITVSKKPANYIKSSPKDGQYYIGDPTVDEDLHSGSTVEEGVLVVGAFYDDRQTTELEVTDLQPRTPYYFSAYAVDNVARYHREGSHSYSLPTGIEESGNEEATPATHGVKIEEPVKLKTSTGLDKNKTYKIEFKTECDDHKIEIDGKNALTYDDMINTINQQLMLLDDPYNSPNMPFKDTIFKLDDVFYRWDGKNKITIDYVLSDTQPNTKIDGTIWFDTDDNNLFIYDDVGDEWDTLDFIDISYDITNPPEGAIWFNSDLNEAWVWKHDKWCELNLIVDTRNPLLPPRLNSSTFWYNTDTLELFKWNKKIGKWEEAWAIYYPSDPNDLLPGSFWFNETDEKVYILQTGGNGWAELTDIRYEEPNEDGELSMPLENTYWYVPSEQTLYKRDPTNIVWVEQDISLYPTDPFDRESCDLWWNSSPSVDYLFVWDKVNQEWDPADNFIESPNDPSKSQKLPEGSVWYNSNDDKLLRILDTTCEDLDYIETPFDPTDPPVGFVWKTGNDFYQWNESGWIPIEPIFSELDPYDLPSGYFWLDNSDVLWVWDGTDWIQVEVLDYDPKPKEGFLWFNTVDNQLYQWHIDQWIEAKPLVYAEFEPSECRDDKDTIMFRTRKTGCDTELEINTDESIFAHLGQRVRYTIPKEGQDLVSGSPMYKRLGVGDDGSPDERRELHNTIRELLGSPATKVELSKSQLDTCIDNALKMLRKYGGQSYKRGFFFLDMKPNQQVYELKDRCVGFHKITDIHAVHRLRSTFLRGAYSGYDLYGYAALKQLYTLGTFDILSFHLVSGFIEELETLFATRITFQWVEQTRELKLYNAIFQPERVLVDGSIERTEQDLINDRETNLWLQRWAVAEAKMVLSQSRGKFQSLPGPNGSTVLNAQELITQSEAEKAMLMEELEDPSMSGSIEVGQKAFFVLG